TDRLEARRRERRLRDRSDTPEPSDRERMEEAPDLLRTHLDQPVRLAGVARDLRHHLPRPDADRDRETGRRPDALLQEAADPERRTEEPDRRRHVDERLVERERLHRRADRREHLPYLPAHAPILR